MGLNETSRFQRYYLSRWPPLTYKSQEIDRNELSLALDYDAIIELINPECEELTTRY